MATSEQNTDTLTLKLSERFPKGPILAAGRLISCLGRPSKRDYNVSVGQQEKNSLFKRISSTRNRSFSPLSSSTSSSSSQMKSSTTTPSNLNQMSKTVVRANAPSTPTPDTIGPDFNYRTTYEQLRQLAETNAEYFSHQKTDVCQRFERLLHHLIESLDSTVPLINFLIENFHHFDYSPQVNLDHRRCLRSNRFVFADPSQRLPNLGHRPRPSGVANAGNSASSRYETCRSAVQSDVFIAAVPRFGVVDENSSCDAPASSSREENGRIFRAQSSLRESIETRNTKRRNRISGRCQ